MPAGNNERDLKSFHLDLQDVTPGSAFRLARLKASFKQRKRESEQIRLRGATLARVLWESLLHFFPPLFRSAAVVFMSVAPQIRDQHIFV